MACGTGKTLTSLWIKEELNAKRTLVLVPSLSLLSQTIREWIGTSRDELNWICVCSDKSVSRQDKTDDAWIEHSSELGVSVTNEITDIQKFLWDNEEGIIFATYQSSPLVTGAQQDPDVPSFDIVFADEAHRCAGKVSEAFGSVLDSQKIRAKKRLFMTATPRVLSSRIKTKADAEDIEVASMDDEGIFGKVLHRLNFSEAINKELLTDYQVVVIGVDDPMVQEQIDHRTLSLTDNGIQTDYETLANHISLAKAIRNYDLQRIITFHGRIKGAQKFSEQHPEIVDWISASSKSDKEIQADYVSGHMTSLERNNKIRQLRILKDGQIGILSNARCLSEGVDVPSLDGIAFIDPRSSQVDIIQAVGRVIRKSESKSFGYIILPVYLGDTETIEEELLASRFKDIWNVILALKTQDDSLNDVLDRLRIELGQRNQSNTNYNGLSKIIFDLPRKVQNTICESIQTILVRNTTDGWQEMYGKLLSFVDENGHARPLQAHETLGNWVGKQRSAYSKDRLSKERICLLENLLGWVWGPHDTDWKDKYQELVQYTNESGHARPPQAHPTLGAWVSTQRIIFKNKTLSQERIGLLENLVGWVWDPRDIDWNNMYLELKKYIKENGHPLPAKKMNLTLRSWVGTQKSAFIDKTISIEHIDLLEKLEGWVWNARVCNWDKKYHELCQYTAEHGHARPLRSHQTLGQWVATQRGNKEKLSQERIDRLIKLKGWVWDPKKSDWDDMYQELCQYTAKYGHARPPRNHQTLGQWVSNQRVIKEKLSQERIDLLESREGWVWDSRKSDWDDMYQELIMFIAENGHARPTRASNPTLCNWTNSQKTTYKKGELSQERIDLLESREGWVWYPHEFDWQDKYQELVRYTKENGIARPPKSHNTLGSWVSKQRSTYSDGRLPKERINLLESLKGWAWSVKSLDQKLD